MSSFNKPNKTCRDCGKPSWGSQCKEHRKEYEKSMERRHLGIPVSDETMIEFNKVTRKPKSKVCKKPKDGRFPWIGKITQ